VTIDQILILLGFALFVFMAYKSGINRGFEHGKRYYENRPIRFEPKVAPRDA
jgi:hypothetical protein